MRNVLGFLDYVRGQCADVPHVKFELLAKSSSRKALGMFDETSLVVCATDPRWLMTTAHEVGHLEQWREKMKLWKRVQEDPDIEEWIAGKIRIRYKKLRGIVRRAQRLELDAERRGLRMCRRFKLGDPGEYARLANVYVWRFDHAMRHKIWVPLERIERAHNVAPDKLMHVDDISNVPHAVECALLEAH